METIAEGTLVVVALDDSLAIGVLNSRIHTSWALAAGSRLGVGNDPRYNKSRCFDPFPFPNPDEATKQRIRELGEQLDAHRKRQQEQYPDLTMTGMYNVLEKLRAGESLTSKDQKIHEQGLVSVLKELHDRLDEAVCDAYGWPHDINDEDILQNLVDLNAERAAEEAAGKNRYLRPEFQDPEGTKTKPKQKDLGITPATKEATKAAAKVKAKKEKRPKSLAERIAAVRGVLAMTTAPLDVDTVAGHFTRARKTDVAELLETLATLGHARQTEDGRFVA